MKIIKKIEQYFSKTEKILWLSSITLILTAFFAFDGKNYLSLASSLVGATSLILNAKGNPIGQVLIIIFSIFYGIISWSFSYYGEVLTYLGMSAPMACFALIAWLKNPYNGNKSEVKVNRIKRKEITVLSVASVAITIIFYFLLKLFNTNNLIPSTVSVTTSFMAAALTYYRSPYFALAYALNDVVLIVLWVLATLQNIGYISVIVCFVVFLINDLYSFYNWRKMQKRQNI